jgi:Mrp family chromosome partitioning ATPase
MQGGLGAAQTLKGAIGADSPREATAAPNILIPRIRRDWFGERLGLKPRLDAACREVLDRPESKFSQAIGRTLAEEIRCGTKKILCVSEQDRSGTTTIAVNLAHSAARAGHRVLLIEANQRRPIFASLLSPNVRVNLIELAGIKRIICQLRPELSLIPLFDTDMTRLLKERTHHCTKGIRKHFDLVILDGGTFIQDNEMAEMAGAVDRVFGVSGKGLSMRRVLDLETMSKSKAVQN